MSLEWQHAPEDRKELRKVLRESARRTARYRRARTRHQVADGLRQLRAGLADTFIYPWLIPLAYRVVRTGHHVWEWARRG